MIQPIVFELLNDESRIDSGPWKDREGQEHLKFSSFSITSIQLLIGLVYIVHRYYFPINSRDHPSSSTVIL